jgi:hypothetical protein
MAIQLTPNQVTDLAEPIVKMLDTISKFYENPDNMRGFREWHIQKYGCEPKEGIGI